MLVLLLEDILRIMDNKTYHCLHIVDRERRRNR